MTVADRRVDTLLETVEIPLVVTLTVLRGDLVSWALPVVVVASVRVRIRLMSIFALVVTDRLRVALMSLLTTALVLDVIVKVFVRDALLLDVDVLVADRVALTARRTLADVVLVALRITFWTRMNTLVAATVDVTLRLTRMTR